MSFELAPDHGDRGEPDVKLGRVGGSAVGEDRRLVRDGVQVIARGAFVCPECALPISPASRIPPGQPVSCPFCAHSGRAEGFLALDAQEGTGNRVSVVARLTTGAARAPQLSAT